MTSIRNPRAALAGAFFCALAALPGTAHAIQVVGDEACQTYAVDIAAFATCENGRVTTPLNCSQGRRLSTMAMPSPSRT